MDSKKNIYSGGSEPQPNDTSESLSYGKPETLESNLKHFDGNTDNGTASNSISGNGTSGSVTAGNGTAGNGTAGNGDADNGTAGGNGAADNSDSGNYFVNESEKVEGNTALEPTVTFNANPVAETERNTGIKVFFALIAVVIALVIALASGFVFGKADAIYNRGTVSTPSLNSVGSSNLNDFAAVYSKIAPSVVSITVYNSTGTKSSTATGLIYSADGYIVTNDHIYAEIASPKFLVTMYDGREYYAEFVAGDTRSDLAVLKIKANNLTPINFRNSDEILVGEQVAAIGYPAGTVKATATEGIISSQSTRISTELSSYTMKVIQTSTPINPGSSGGALVDMSSYVIGITSAKLSLSGYENIGYAIPSKTVVSVVDSLIKNGHVEGRGKLGITYTFINSVVSDLKGGLPRGLLISEISKESSFSGKNLNTDDIITHINDIELKTRDIALDIIESATPGTSLSFTVYHQDTKQTEVIYAALLQDYGNSSYTENIFGADKNGAFDIFGDGSDSYSDH